MQTARPGSLVQHPPLPPLPPPSHPPVHAPAKTAPGRPRQRRRGRLQRQAHARRRGSAAAAAALMGSGLRGRVGMHAHKIALVGFWMACMRCNPCEGNPLMGLTRKTASWLPLTACTASAASSWYAFSRAKASASSASASAAEDRMRVASCASAASPYSRKCGGGSEHVGGGEQSGGWAAGGALEAAPARAPLHWRIPCHSRCGSAPSAPVRAAGRPLCRRPASPPHPTPAAPWVLALAI